MSGEHGSICEFKKLLDGDALEPPAGQIFQNQPGIFEAVGCQVVKKENISVPETCHRLDAETDGIRNASSGITAGNGPVDHGNGKGSGKPFLVPSGDADHGGIYAGDGRKFLTHLLEFFKELIRRDGPVVGKTVTLEGEACILLKKKNVVV